MKPISWLLLLFSLPTNRNTERVAVWRRLKKIGAMQIKTSTYLLPDASAQYEQFQWLAQQIRDYGGDSTLVRAQEIEGLNKEKVVAMFNDVRAKDYGQLRKALQGFIARRKRTDAEEAVSELERLTRQFREIRAVDFFARPPRPQVDRVGSGWLIPRFIDRKPKFAFASTADAIPGVIPFDMLDAEFSHHGNYCTFETLTRRFAISDKSLA